MIKIYIRNETRVNYPPTKPKSDGNRTWNSWDNFNYIGERIDHEDLVYVVLMTDTTGNNIGNNPKYSDFYRKIYHTPPYRPNQPKPTYPIKSVNQVESVDYHITTPVDSTHLYILNAFGEDVDWVVHELDANGNTTSSHNLPRNQKNYLVELDNPITPRVRIVTSSFGCKGFYTVAFANEFELDTVCVGCPVRVRKKVEVPSEYLITGERVVNSNKIVGDGDLTIDVSKKDAEDIYNLGYDLIDKPIFIVYEDDPNHRSNKYGYFSYIDITEECDNDEVEFKAQVKEFPFDNFNECDIEIFPPELYFCCALDQPDASSPKIRALEDFGYKSPYPLFHLNTDYEVWDGADLVRARYSQDGFRSFHSVFGRLDKGKTYTFKVRFRATNGQVSPWATKLGTVTNTLNHCIDQCIQPFCDDSCQLFMRLSKRNTDDDVNGLGWGGNVGWYSSPSDNCFSAVWLDDTHILEQDEGNIWYPFRYGLANDVISITGNIATSKAVVSTNTNDPFVIVYGDFLIMISNNQAGENNAPPEYKGLKIAMHNKDNPNEVSSWVDLGVDIKFQFNHYVFNVQLSTRRVQVFMDGIEIFNDILPNDEATQDCTNQDFGKYQIGKVNPCVVTPTNLRGTIRGFSIFPRWLSQEEAMELHDYYYV